MNRASIFRTAAALTLLSAGCGGGNDRAVRDAAAPAVATAADAGRDAGTVRTGPRRAMAKRFAAYVRTSPHPTAPRLGYIRAGALMRTKSGTPAGFDGCEGGWYELDPMGYVCNGFDVVVFDGRRLPFGRGRPPALDAPLPYEYGVVRREAPLYRRLPTDEEAVIHEGYVIPGTEPVPGEEGGAASEGGAEATSGADTPAAPPEAPAAPAAPSAAPAAPAAGQVAATGPATAAEDVPAEELGPPTLADLQGERGSVVARRLMPGFLLSLDKTFHAGARRYWRTQSNGFVPLARVGRRQSSTDFQGVALDGAEWQLPVAFEVERGASYYQRDARGRMRTARGRMAYHDHARVLGRETVDGTTYLALPGDRFVRESDVVVVEARTRPPEVGASDYWIDIDLTHQTVTAYEGDRAVYVTLTSTGRPGQGDDDFRTPTGVYRIETKHIATTMDGDVASDGPYSIEDVPYVMYFFRSYAIHGAFWHDRFGHVRSHGCVNLAPLDARWLFRWAPPHLEDGWHGAIATAERPGAWVVVHGESPE